MREAMVDFPITLEAVNAMAVPDLVAAFGDVAEHSPWVATRAPRHSAPSPAGAP